MAACLAGQLFAAAGNSLNKDSLQSAVHAQNLAGKSQLSSEFLEDTYLHFSLEHVLSNYYDFVTYQLESTGEFSGPDRYTFSFHGNSYKWNQYTVDHHRIDDAFFPGSSLHKIILFDTDLELDRTNSRINFSSNPGERSRYHAHWNQGGIGGRIPYADEYVNFWHGHNSSYQDAYQPIEHRKKTAGEGLFYFSEDLGKYRQSGYFNFGRRYHTGFGPEGIDDYYPEDYRQFHLNGRLKLPGSVEQIGYLLSYSSRDNLFSEFNYDKQETARLNQMNTSVFMKGRSFNTGVNVGFKHINHVTHGFSRNIIDQDGEGLEPWYPSSRVLQITLNHYQAGKVRWVDRGLKYKFELNNTFMHQSPLGNLTSNSMYMQRTQKEFQALQVIEWNSTSFSSGLLENTGGLSYIHNFGNSAGVTVSADLTYDGFMIRDKSYAAPNYQATLNGYFKPIRRIKVGLDLGRRRIPFHYDYIRFFSNDYLSGRSFFWNDSNNDEIYQLEERGDLLANTGGKFHSMNDELRQPVMNFVELSADLDLGNSWSMFWSGTYRSFLELWTTQYTRPLNELGHFAEVGSDRSVFFLDGGQDVRFTVKPYNRQTDDQGLSQGMSEQHNPYYAASTIKLQKEGRLFLTTSFTAQMSVGTGAFGNGVLHNDLDVLSESTANPNSRLKSLGRLDSDRAYIVRSLLGYKILPGLAMSFQLLYRDGQPTSLMVSTLFESEKGSQVGLRNVSPKGANPYTGEFGYREPGYWNYELRFRYSPKGMHDSISLSLYVYNLLDVGTTLNYYNFSPGQAHSPYTLDVQIPRGVMLGLNFRI